MAGNLTQQTAWWRPGPALLATLVLVGAAAPTAAQGRAEWCPEPEVAAFDFWLGEWDVANRNRPPGGDEWYRTGDATNRVYAVVGGCALVEHWRGYAFPAAGHVVGFSVRAWEPATRAWKVVLLWPMLAPPAFGTAIGRFEDGRGRFTNRFVDQAGDSVITSLNFYDIREDAFRWSNGVSRDGGRSWDATWIMDFTRRPRAATGLWNGPAMTTGRCPGAEHRAFDPLLGEWTGTRVRADGDSAAVRTHLVSILHGCAVMQRTWAEDGTREVFRVRAYEPGRERWVEYALASDRRALVRREAPPGAAEWVFTDVEPAPWAWRRTRWTLAEGAFAWIEEAAPAADGPWSTIAETRLHERVGQPPGQQGRQGR